MDGLLDGNSLWQCYETDHERAKYERRINDFLLPIIRRHRPSNILEVGAGNGYGTLYLANLGFDVHAVDPFFRDDIQTDYPFMHKGSGLSMPYFEDSAFDLSFSLEVIEHVGTVDGMLGLAADFQEQRFQFIAELCRVTRHAVILATPNKRFPVDEHGSSFLGSFRVHSPFERETLSVRELKRMFAVHGFEISEYLDPLGYYSLERVQKLSGRRLAKVINSGLRATNNRLLGQTFLNPHLFLSFRRA